MSRGQLTDRFTKAIDQLDDEKALAVRLGGLYALERIAHDSPAERATVAEVLCAYARTAPRSLAEPPVGPPQYPPLFGNSIDSIGNGRRLAVRAPDIQTALTILGRWQARLGELPPHLDLHRADLQGADLAHVQLPGANLNGAQLQEADLNHAQLQNANLNGAQMEGTDLNHAQLQGARLYGADLQRSNLWGANLRSAFLSGATLQGANLFWADLQDAFADETTQWPDEWDRERLEKAGVQYPTR